MDALMIVALVLQVFLLLIIVGAWVGLAIMPGRIAKERGHPQADSIKVCGWIGAITMGVFSPIAFIWAYSRPVFQSIERKPSLDGEPNSDSGDEGEGES